MDTNPLEKIGFTKSEIKVYLALLKLGQTTTGPLTTKAKVSRSKVYEILEKLKEKGLVSFVIKENTKYFEAASPKNIEQYLKKKKQELNNDEKAVKALLPHLEAVKTNTSSSQSATLFSGYAGLRTVFNIILSELKKNDEYYAFAMQEKKYTKSFSTFIMNYHKKREEKGIKVKLLASKKIKKKVLNELGCYKHIKFRFTEEKSPNATLIFKSKVFIFTWENPAAFLIESKEIANQHKEHFLDIWKRTCTYN